MSLERGEERKDSLRLVKCEISNLAAVASVPAKRGAVEAPRFLVSDEEGELERVSKDDVVISEAAESAAVAFRDAGGDGPGN